MRIRQNQVISHQTWLVCSEQALATVRQVRSLNFHRDLDTRNSTEVASVWRKASSPYSFHRNVTVATLSMMTITAVTMRNTCKDELSNSDQLADIKYQYNETCENLDEEKEIIVLSECEALL